MVEQHNNHVLMCIGEDTWAIHSISGHIFYFWRIHNDDYEYSLMDMSEFRAEEYCDKAVEMMEKQYGYNYSHN